MLFHWEFPGVEKSQAGHVRSVCSGFGMSLTKGLLGDQRIKAVNATQNILINEKYIIFLFRKPKFF